MKKSTSQAYFFTGQKEPFCVTYTLISIQLIEIKYYVDCKLKEEARTKLKCNCFYLLFPLHLNSLPCFLHDSICWAHSDSFLFIQTATVKKQSYVIKNVLTIIQYSCYFSNFLYVTLLYTQQKISECSQQNNCKKWSLIIEFSFSLWYKLYVSWKFKCYFRIAFSFLNLAPSRQEVKHRNNNITTSCFSK